MSVFKHNIFRSQQGINAKEEFILSLVKEFGELKSTTISTMCRTYGVYTTLETSRKAILDLKDKGFIVGIESSSRRTARFFLWQLTPTGKYYFQQVKDLYC